MEFQYQLDYKKHYDLQIIDLEYKEMNQNIYQLAIRIHLKKKKNVLDPSGKQTNVFGIDGCGN
jgi:hypothetical protein